MISEHAAPHRGGGASNYPSDELPRRQVPDRDPFLEQGLHHGFRRLETEHVRDGRVGQSTVDQPQSAVGFGEADEDVGRPGHLEDGGFASVADLVDARDLAEANGQSCEGGFEPGEAFGHGVDGHGHMVGLGSEPGSWSPPLGGWRRIRTSVG